MAILSKPRILPQQRFDLEDFNALLAFLAADQKHWTKQFWSSGAKILKGFNVTSGVGAASPAAVNLAGATLVNANNTGAFAWFVGDTGEADISVPLNANSRNYLEISLTTEDGTPLPKTFWNPATLVEFQQVIDTVTNLKAEVVVLTGGFSGSSDRLPIAIIDTDSSNNIKVILDKRAGFFRNESDFSWASRIDPVTSLVLTGVVGTFEAGETVTFSSGATGVVVSGGSSPITVNYLSSDALAAGNTVTGGTSGATGTVSTASEAFTGGDKDIGDLYSVLQAIMTEIRLMKGTTSWMNSAPGSLSGVFRWVDSCIVPTGQGSSRFAWNGSNLTITDDNGGPTATNHIAYIRLFETDALYTLSRQDGQAGTSTIPIGDNQVLYVTLPSGSGDRLFDEPGSGDTNFKVADIGDYVSNDQNYWIACRRGSRLVLRWGTELESGESDEIGDTLSSELLANLGLASETAPFDYTDAGSIPNGNIRGAANEPLNERVGKLSDNQGDYQEDRSGTLFSATEVVWSGTQLTFNSDLTLELINTKSGTLTQHNILSGSFSPLSLNDGESAWISISRTTASENVTLNRSSVTPIPAQSQANKNVFVLFKRYGTLLLCPFIKQLLEPGETTYLMGSQTPQPINTVTGTLPAGSTTFSFGGKTFPFNKFGSEQVGSFWVLVDGSLALRNSANGSTGPLNQYQEIDAGGGETGSIIFNQSDSKDRQITVIGVQNAFANVLDGSGVAGQVAYWSATDTLTSDVDFQFNGSQLLLGDGLLATPAYSFVADPDTGLYRSATNQLSLITAGVERLRINSVGTVVVNSGALYTQDGSAGSPGIAFNNDTDTGLLRPTSNQIAITAGGSQFFRIINSTPSAVIVEGGAILRIESGTAVAPSLTFNAEQDVGLYRVGTDQLGFAAAGVLRAQIDTQGLKLQDGSVAAPAYSFTGDTDTGIYRATSGRINFSANGVQAGYIDSTGLLVDLGQVQAQGGSVSAPGYAFDGDLNTGMFSASADSLALAVGGASALAIDSSGNVAMTLNQIRASNNGVSFPAYSFSGDNNTGMYNVGADQLGFATNGTIALYLSATQRAQFVDGADGAPSISFLNGTGLGFYRVGVTSTGVSGVLGVTDGSVGAPGLVFASDLDTGMYRVGVNSLGFATAGVSALTISATQAATFSANVVISSSAGPQLTLTDGGTIGVNSDPFVEYRDGVGAQARVGFTNAASTRFQFTQLSGGDFQFNTGDVYFEDGADTTPSIGFINDTGVGWFRAGSGLIGASGRLMLRDGSSGAPSLSFNNAGGIGLYRIGSNAFGFSGTLGGSDGSAALPAYTFSGDNDTGLYRVGVNSVGIATAGVLRTTIDTTGVLVNSGQFQAANGSAAAPSIVFTSGDLDTGLYRQSADNIGVSIAGALKLSFNTDGLTMNTGQILVTAGSAAAPSLAFSADTNTGMYSAGADQIAFATGGTFRARFDVSGLGVIAGSVTAPSLSFSGDPNTGLYNSTGDELSITAGGVQIARFNNLGMTITNNGILNNGGTAASPTYTFGADTDTGMFRNNEDEIAFATGGVRFWRWNSTVGFIVENGADIQIANDGHLRITTSGTGADPGAPTNEVRLGGQDSSDNNMTFHFRTEQAPEATATFTQTHRVKVYWNGAEYWLSLDAVV